MGNALNGMVHGFSSGYALGRRMKTDRAEDEKLSEMKAAGSLAPTQEFSPEQAAELEAAAGVKDAEGNPLYQIKGNEGGTYSVTPTAGGETGTVAPGMQRMGGKTQATPFSQEQIEAQRYRNQADVATRFGDFREASALQGLAKGREEEGVTKSIKSFADEGLKRHGDLTGAKKQWKQLSYMAEAAANAGRMDLWKQYRDSGLAVRGDLMKDAINRADMLYRTTGSIHGYVDAHSDLALDGRHAAAVKTLDDGRHEVQFGNDLPPVIVGDKDDPKNRQISVGTLRLLLSDPAKLAEYEQKATERRIERAQKREDSQHEWENKPVALSKDQTLVSPGTGKTFSPRQAGQFDPKEANSVLDDVRTIFRDKYGIERDPATGMPKDPMAKSAWTDQAISKANLAERVFMKNPGLPPAMLAEIADKGQTGDAVVDVGGKQQRVPSVTYNGRTFLLGGADVGQELSSGQNPSAAPSVTSSGLGTRDVRGKIGGGMQKIGPQSSATPQDFPRVSSSDQTSRDINAGHILVAEAGGLEGAKRDLAMLDAELSRRGLDGTQRGILQSQRNRLAAGIAAVSQQG